MDLTEIKVDTLEDLENRDISGALLHMNLASQQLGIDLPYTTQGNQTTTPKASTIPEKQLTTESQAPEAETQNHYNLTIGNETFSIKYQLNNATLNKINPVMNQASLLLNITSNEDGSLTIDLPRKLIDSKGHSNEDEEFIVFADGQQIFGEEIAKNNNELRTLNVDFEEGVEELEIVGTQMVQVSPTGTSIIQTNETAATQGVVPPQVEGNKTVSPPTEFLTFESIAPDVKIKYPSSWTTGGPNVSEPITIINSFYSPEPDDYAEVTVGVDYTYRAHSNLNDFLSEAINSYTMYPEYFPDFRLDYSSADNTTLSGNSAYLLEGRYNDPQFGIQKVMEVGTIIGNKGFFVTYFASPSLYSHYLPIVQEMLDSIEIVPSSAAGSELHSFIQPPTTEEQVPQQTIPSEAQDTTINVHLDTHIYTIRDQPVKVRILNPEQSDYQWRTLTVPSTGGVTESFTITNDFIPEGYGFMVCVTNERNDKEDCKQAVRERGSGQTDVFITVP